jgi:hypothetical protein
MAYTTGSHQQAARETSFIRWIGNSGGTQSMKMRFLTTALVRLGGASCFQDDRLRSDLASLQ